MEKLFKLKNGELEINKEFVFMIDAFKAVWDNDKSNNKVKAKSWFKYIFISQDVSHNNPYWNRSEEDRHNKGLENSSITEKDLTNPILLAAINEYNDIQFQSVTLSLVNKMYKAVKKLETYYENVDFSKIVESGAKKGTMLYSPIELQNSIEKSDKTFETLRKLKELVREELAQEEKQTRGKTTLNWKAKQLGNE